MLLIKIKFHLYSQEYNHSLREGCKNVILAAFASPFEGSKELVACHQLSSCNKWSFAINMKWCSQSADLKFSCRAEKHIWTVTLIELRLTTRASNSCFQSLLLSHYWSVTWCLDSVALHAHQPVLEAAWFSLTSLLLVLCPFPTPPMFSSASVPHFFTA